MTDTSRWTVEHYKDFEIWLSDPHAAGPWAASREWRCELRILRLNPDANRQNIVVRTIQSSDGDDTPDGMFVCAFIESLRICDRLLQD